VKHGLNPLGKQVKAE
jgi:hypothetical protein